MKGNPLLLTALLVLAGVKAAAAPPPGPTALATPAAPAGGVRTLYLVRHGAYDSADPRDESVGKGLFPIGVAQARLAGDRLRALPFRFDALLVSPFTRARETAGVISGVLDGLPPHVDPDLAECTPPTRRTDVMAREKPERVAACVAQLERLAARLLVPSPGGDRHELVVAHGNVIRYLVTRALAVDPAAWLGLSIGHASLTVLSIDPRAGVRVLSVGDVGHIPPPLQTGGVGDPDPNLAVPAPPRSSAPTP